jgi:hypothetical protein
VDWIHLDENRYKWQVLVNTVMNLRVPQEGRDFLSSSFTVGISRRLASYY